MVWEGSVFRRRESPAANATFHGCGKRSHWQQVCCLSPANNVAASLEDETNGSQLACLVIHEVLHVNSAPKEIFVELGLSPSPSRSNHRMLRFEVDSGCSCNTIHSNLVPRAFPLKMGGAGKGLFPPHPFFKGKALGMRLHPLY